MRLHEGEPAATGWHVVTVPEAVRRLRAASSAGGGGPLRTGSPAGTASSAVPTSLAGTASPAGAGRPLVIGIDGRGGAGKTVLAERLRAAVPRSAVVHTDDVAWHHAFFDWGAVLTDNILKPLHRGTPVDFRPDAWARHDRPGSITVPAGADIVWVEGTGVIRAELDPWLDASVWVQGDLDDQERRLAARDGDSPQQREHVANWLREELPFLLREQPWARATMIVAGAPALDHDPDTELVVAPPVRPH